MVITTICVGVKDKGCVPVCPVDCIYEGERQLYIHPDECIDCGACEPACPVGRSFSKETCPRSTETLSGRTRTSSRMEWRARRRRRDPKALAWGQLLEVERHLPGSEAARALLRLARSDRSRSKVIERPRELDELLALLLDLDGVHSDASISPTPAPIAAVPAVRAAAEARGSCASCAPRRADTRPPAAIRVDPVEYCVSGGT
jgi:NAD-dependent dihydropyrimidine dehydrogenase PreA subunit